VACSGAYANAVRSSLLRTMNRFTSAHGGEQSDDSQDATYSLHHGLPIAEFRLPKEAHGGIPGAILTYLEPTPVGRKWQQNPRWNAECASQMRRGIIDRYHQVQRRDLCRKGINV
jgi:hypothetical protein